jgi:hypothetical protein
MQEEFKIDKDLPNKLDGFLKYGNLDRETEILRILETLSEKLNALENKESIPNAPEKDEERGKNRIHNKWGRDPFKQET